MNSFSLLDGLTVATPCPASWDAMAGDDRVRFCPACRLNVYNLSALGRPEAEALLRQKEGRVCLRFYRWADGTVLTRDCPVGLRAARRNLGLVAGTVAATLLMGLALLTCLADSTRGRAEGTAWLRQVEPFKSLLEWLDPTPAPPSPGNWHMGW